MVAVSRISRCDDNIYGVIKMIINKFQSRLINRTIAAITLLFLLAGSGAAGAVSIISEDFNTSVLDPKWTTVPGLGTYSLTANPGYLRYLSNDYYACSGDWLQNCDDGPWRHSNTTIQNFSGENWIMDSKITYHLRQRKGSFAGPQGIAI